MAEQPPDADDEIDDPADKHLVAELRRLSSHPPKEADPAALARVMTQLDREMGLNGGQFPETLGGHRVLREIGRGGMGVVYLADHNRLPRRIAIKLIHPGLTHVPDFRRRFVEEANKMAKVDGNENVALIYDAGEEDGGRLYLVMEYLEGTTLEHWLAAGRGESLATDVIWVAQNVLKGLKAIHNAGEKDMVHRDIKPSNLWVSSGKVKIIDFGIATQTGKITNTWGTTGYMAPEQNVAGGVVDNRTDLYSLGAVLYRMVTGKTPPLATSLTLPGSIFAGELRQRNLPSELTEFICRLLCPKPEDRPATAEAALGELKAVCDRQPQAAGNTWVWMTIGVAVTLGIVIGGLIDRYGGRWP